MNLNSEKIYLNSSKICLNLRKRISFENQLLTCLNSNKFFSEFLDLNRFQNIRCNNFKYFFSCVKLLKNEFSKL